MTVTKGISDEQLIAAIKDDDMANDLLDQLKKRIVEIVAAEYEDDGGYCSYEWHRSKAEFDSHGICTICQEPRADHISILVCAHEVEEDSSDGH